MSFISDIFSERMIFALGWTFINSLWQGGFICMVNWIVLLMLSKRNARLRYVISSVSLFSILLFAVISFLMLNNYYDLYLSNPAGTGGINDTGVPGIYGIFFLEYIPFDSTGYLDYFNNNLPLIFSVWFWTVLFLSLKQMGGFALTQRLGHYKTTLPSSDWQNKVAFLSDKLGIKKSVKLLESAIVKVPTVIGFFKPVILMPLGLLFAIPGEQLETILLHELAHIKRRDFVVNILQNILEVIFFFNPFVWLISSNVRSEREHCCDDMVVDISGDTLTYIKALAGISAMDSVKSGYAMALSLNHNHLLKRIDRIIKMKNYKNNFNRVFISAFILVLGVSFLCVNAVNGFNKYPDKSVLSPQSRLQQEEKQSKKSEEKSAKLKQQTDDSEKTKKENMMKELEEKYNSTSDPEVKKEIKKKIETLRDTEKDYKKDKNADLKKKEQISKELKKKYDAETDEEAKAKIKQKMEEMENSPQPPPPPKGEQISKNSQMISELKKKYELSTDADEKKEIEKKIKSLSQDPPPPPPPSKEAELEKKKQKIAELEKKYAAAKDEATKKKLESEINKIKKQ